MMMKKLLVFGSIVLALNSCSKSDDSPGCTATAPTAIADASEVTTLQAYATSNYPAAIKHSSGFFYEISAAGTGTVIAQPCSKITVTYSRYSIPGNVKLEDNVTTTFTLGLLIQAWQYAIPMIKTGGSMMLLVPPSLAYSDGNYHKFYIQLTAIQ